jgi:hypothetical protein
MSRASSIMFRSMTSMACRALSPSSFPECNSRTHPSIALRGVRSSCESTARNSSFMMLKRSNSSDRLRASTSTKAMTAPSILLSVLR